MHMVRNATRVWLAVLGIAAALQGPSSSALELSGAAAGAGVGPQSFRRESGFGAGHRLVNDLLEGNGNFTERDQGIVRERFRHVPIHLLPRMNGVKLSGIADLPREKVCAMVSSSRVLLSDKAGEKIDLTLGPVVRFNHAPTVHFEEYVGSRTDILVANDAVPCKWKETNSGPPPEAQHVVLNTFGKSIPAECLKYVRSNFPRVGLYILDFMPMNVALQGLMLSTASSIHAIKLSSHQKQTDFWLTTGMAGAVLVLNMCEEVHHYGFLPEQDDGTGNDCKQHYWDLNNTHCDSDSHHALNSEHIIWAAMSERGEFPIEGIVRIPVLKPPRVKI